MFFFYMLTPFFSFYVFKSDQSVGSLKQELGKILPELEEMQKRKTERRSQFLLVLEEIENITNDIKGQGQHVLSKPLVDETDLSMRKLEELHSHLQALQKEKVKFNLNFFFFGYLFIYVLCFVVSFRVNEWRPFGSTCVLCILIAQYLEWTSMRSLAK